MTAPSVFPSLDEQGREPADLCFACICCNGIGWHESECGGRHHCLKCDGTGVAAATGRETAR